MKYLSTAGLVAVWSGVVSLPMMGGPDSSRYVAILLPWADQQEVVEMVTDHGGYVSGAPSRNALEVFDPEFRVPSLRLRRLGVIGFFSPGISMLCTPTETADPEEARP